MPNKPVPAAAEGMPHFNETNRRSARSTQSRQKTIDGLMAKAKVSAGAITLTSEYIAHTLEEVHGCPFKVKIGDGCSFVLIIRVR